MLVPPTLLMPLGAPKAIPRSVKNLKNGSLISFEMPTLSTSDISRAYIFLKLHMNLWEEQALILQTLLGSLGGRGPQRYLRNEHKRPKMGENSHFFAVGWWVWRLTARSLCSRRDMFVLYIYASYADAAHCHQPQKLSGFHVLAMVTLMVVKNVFFFHHTT